MSDSDITPETFQHLAGLAALELNPEESEYLRGQLNNQLKAIHDLTAIPLDPSIPPARHGVPFNAEQKPALREDEWLPYPDPSDILAQAPETDERYFVVPDIPHTKLD